jgi:hypothetical protein
MWVPGMYDASVYKHATEAEGKSEGAATAAATGSEEGGKKEAAAVAAAPEAPAATN